MHLRDRRKGIVRSRFWTGEAASASHRSWRPSCSQISRSSTTFRDLPTVVAVAPRPGFPTSRSGTTTRVFDRRFTLVTASGFLAVLTGRGGPPLSSLASAGKYLLLTRTPMTLGDDSFVVRQHTPTARATPAGSSTDKSCCLKRNTTGSHSAREFLEGWSVVVPGRANSKRTPGIPVFFIVAAGARTSTPDDRARSSSNDQSWA